MNEDLENLLRQMPLAAPGPELDRRVLRARRPRLPALGVMGWAAAAAVLAAVLLWRVLPAGHAPLPVPHPAPPMVATVALDPHDRVTPYPDGRFQVLTPRAVRLESGAVLVDVHHAAEPFVVQTPAGELTVLGTRFIVNTYAEGDTPMTTTRFVTTLAVLAGVVQLSNPLGSQMVQAGDQAVAATDLAPVQLVLNTPPGRAAPAPTPATQPASAKADAASRITLDFKNMTLAQAVQKLAALSGNKPFALGPDLKDKTVTLAVRDMPYWEAVDQLIAPLHLLYNPTWVGVPGRGEYGLQLAESPKGVKAADYTGYAGPVVVKLDAVSQVRYLRTFKGVAGQQPDPDGFNVKLTYYWEDRLDPLSEEVELTKVQTPKGDSLLPTAPEARRKVGSTGTVGIQMVKFAPCRDVLFNLPMPGPEVRTIDELGGVVRLEYASGERLLTIANVLDAVGKEIKDGDWTVKVVKAEDLNDLLQVDLEVRYKGELTAMPSWWTIGSYGWHVQADAGGVLMRGSAYSGGGGGGGDPRHGGGGPAATTKNGQRTFIFPSKPDAGSPTLVLKLPETHQTKEYPFTIRGVALP